MKLKEQYSLIKHLLAAALLSSCTFENRAPESGQDIELDNEPSTVKIKDHITGIWILNEVYKGEKNVTNEDTVADDRVLHFTREAGYVRYSGHQPIDSGGYDVNERHGYVHMRSEYASQPSEWAVSFSGDGFLTMEKRGVRGVGQSIRYVYRRRNDTDNIELPGKGNVDLLPTR